MKKAEWFGMVKYEDRLAQEIEKLLEDKSDTLPFWSINHDRIIIEEWQLDWKPTRFELMFDFPYAKGLVYPGESEKDFKRFETICAMLRLINEETPDIVFHPEIDYRTGFYLSLT